MVRTASTMLPLGTRAPEFTLPRVDTGAMVSLRDFANAPATMVMFLCNHCPYVKHVAPEVARLTAEYAKRGVAIVAISSNDATAYVDDSPEELAKDAKARGYTFPYLYDESQAVAKAFNAACTPEFYIFGRNFELVYRGQLDDSRPKNDVPLSGRDVRAALDAVLAGRPVDDTQIPSIGCNIKWKEPPVYFNPRGVA